MVTGPADEMEKPTRSGPGTPFPPTLMYIAGFVAGWWVESRIPAFDVSWPAIVTAAGWCLVVGGAMLFSWGLATFWRMRTGIMLQTAATRVVDRPPYCWSRNPMYVSFTAMYVGLALVIGLWWPFILLPVVMVVLTAVVISREERYMRATFGSDYDEYCRRVRRWI